jgi:hypothetical protein
MKVLESAIYQYLMDVCTYGYEKCFQKWIDHLKKCIQVKDEYFERQGGIKRSMINKCG